MKFSYQVFRGFYYPIIPIKLSKEGGEVNTSAIVDSGASISIFNSSVGRQIGIDIESGEKRIFQGASAKLSGYVHEVKMMIGGMEIICKAAFSDELVTSFNLLGRETVFDKFIITFNEKHREIRIDSV
ncbi:retropepsin-like domain-containing protein [Candidatus Woesearchaeota archaeon]|nr:retropepsin-like domain-containing protein [Candidatus Woesearchaeota archaeon]